VRFCTKVIFSKMVIFVYRYVPPPHLVMRSVCKCLLFQFQFPSESAVAFHHHHHHHLLLVLLNVTDAEQEVEWRRDLINILSQVPQSVRVVMRYLFAFLNQ